MRICDGHIHIMENREDFSGFLTGLDEAGISGGNILSLPPGNWQGGEYDFSFSDRIEGLMRCAGERPGLHPFFWIDPVDRHAAEEVTQAVRAGVAGFKVICRDFYPCEPEAMRIYRRIADAGKPIMFHSGILWDGRPSSKYNRPAEFEGLIDVEGLRFSLAHISWPWIDEHIAVYGKLLAAGNRDIEMFIDTTPGTPPIYREEALTKVYRVGYDVADNVFFGSDGTAPDYNAAWVRQWVERDTQILASLKLETTVPERYFSRNLERFVSG